MPNHVKHKVRLPSNSGWSAAIAEAERHLVLAKRRVEGLKRVVQNWRRLRDDGMPWPGQLTDQSSDQQHSV